MTRFAWRDCALTLEEGCVTLENAALRTHWLLGPEGLALRAVENRATGFCWQSPEQEAFFPACMQPPPGAPQWTADVESSPLTADCWALCCTWRQGARAVRRHFRLFPQSPFLIMWTAWDAPPEGLFSGGPAVAESPTGIEQAPGRPAGRLCRVPGDVMAALPLPSGHLRWRCVRLTDQTDTHDTLTWETRAPVYPPETVECAGSFFIVEAPDAQESLFAARHAPVPHTPGAQFRLAGGCLCVLQNGCGGTLPEAAAGCACVIGATATRQLWPQYRAFYRLGWRAPWQQRPLLLSNTWGDRNRDGRVCEAFVRQEIDCAALLGLDAVQIDDGWQRGTTVNSARPAGGVWEGYYAADPDFWTPHPQRFPQGLGPVARYAAQRGVALGLWFSPDSSHAFANWKRDADTLLSLWRGLGIAIFKLDGVKLRTVAARAGYLSFLNAVSVESQGRIQLQQDITAEQRLGYLAAREYGTLFVENRYTDFGSYYPHRTLRNLWMLSRYLPAQRLLFELLNPARNRARYAGDPLAPGCYTADYLFAITLAAQPLFWMELSALSEEDTQRLRAVIAVYKRHRAALWACDVQPIGQEPDGHSFSGFAFYAARGDGYLLLFREATAADCFTFADAPQDAALRLLYAGGPVRHTKTRDGRLQVHFAQPRSYAFFRWRPQCTS